ncbi:type II toxin-antitoxin system VapC family toxin [Niveispirillum sp. KHB5.9]|uniref:type II toxin-antitoxin system VapC family toxin n=1 Tax=Niveispirillum sp. KHB5.9 TaxID=3400269 RepID=UPI003A8609BF
MSFVIDSSVLMSFLLPDEPDDRTLHLLDRLSYDGAFAPVLLKYEIMNALLAAERRRRVEPSYRLQALAQFQRMPIQFDLPTEPDLWRQVADLAAKHNLTGYDASYLALAMRLGVPVATYDREIIAAARSLSVPLF